MNVLKELHRLVRWFDEFESYEGMTDDEIKDSMRKESIAQKQYEYQQYVRLPRLRKEAEETDIHPGQKVRWR